MTDLVETLKVQLRKGYELGDGNLCIVAARDLEAFIAEIERLRSLREHDAAVIQHWMDADDKSEAEIERLRAALQEIIRLGGAEDTLACIARSALEPKP